MDLYKKPKLPYTMNLQFFAEENETEDVEEEEEQEEEEEKTFTQEDMDKVLQQRLAKERKKYEQERKEQEKEMKERLEVEKKEAAELAKLSEEERQKVEAEKREIEIKQREEELESKEREFQRKKLELDTMDVLKERKLPTDFAKMVMGEDSESTLDNIVNFQEQWKTAVEAEVNNRLSTGVPKAGNKKTGEYNPWKKDTLNLTEQGRIMRENPDLAKKLKAQA